MKNTKAHTIYGIFFKLPIAKLKQVESKINKNAKWYFVTKVVLNCEKKMFQWETKDRQEGN